MSQQFPGWIALTFGTEIHVPLMVNCSHFGEPQNSDIAPSTGQILKMSNTLCFAYAVLINQLKGLLTSVAVL